MPPRIPRAAAAILAVLAASGGARAAVIEIQPGTDVFGPAAQALSAGDTLVVHEGKYVETQRMSIQVVGTPTAHVIIRGAPGEARPLITRDPSATAQNTINIEGAASYLTLSGLEVTSVSGDDGVKLSGTDPSNPSYIVLEDLVIHDVGLGINLVGNIHHVTVRANEIALAAADGIQFGCASSTCAVWDSAILGNWIRDSPGASTGVSIRATSYGNTVVDNVIHTGFGTGIAMYGGGSSANLVEGNFVTDVGEGIYAVSDTVVRNNLVVACGTGLSLFAHVEVPVLRNTTVVHNTLYANPEGLFLRWAGTAMTLANNAIYSPGGVAVNSGSGTQGKVGANFVEGTLDVDDVDGVRFVSGGEAAAAFVDPAVVDLFPRPGSPLLGAADSVHAVSIDFNGTPRTAPYDVGAYETEGLATNPGWRPAGGFKASSNGGPPDAGADAGPPSGSIALELGCGCGPGGGATAAWTTLLAAVALGVLRRRLGPRSPGHA